MKALLVVAWLHYPKRNYVRSCRVVMSHTGRFIWIPPVYRRNSGR